MGRRATTSAEDLTDSVLRVVRRCGVAGVSSRSVAAEAGVALGTVYRHVPDLENLLVAATERVEARFVAAMRSAAPEGELLVPAVPRIAAALVEEARCEPRLAELLAVARRPAATSDGARIQRWIAERVSSAAAMGEIAARDTDVTAAAGYGLVRGVVEHVLGGSGGWEAALPVLTAGLRGLLEPTIDRP